MTPEQITESELRREKDLAIAEANRRDKKWMEGINAACGIELCYDPIEGDKSVCIARMPTLDEYIADLKKQIFDLRCQNEKLERYIMHQVQPMNERDGGI